MGYSTQDSRLIDGHDDRPLDFGAPHVWTPKRASTEILLEIATSPVKQPLSSSPILTSQTRCETPKGWKNGRDMEDKR